MNDLIDRLLIYSAAAIEWCDWLAVDIFSCSYWMMWLTGCWYIQLPPMNDVIDWLLIYSAAAIEWCDWLAVDIFSCHQWM